MKLRASVLGLLLLLALLAPVLETHDPNAQDRAQASTPPGSNHWLGTDEYGRDLWSRYVAGGRWSFAAGLGATLLTFLLAWTIGGAAGFLGGWTDRLLMRLAELFLVLPWFYALLAARALLPLHLSGRTAFLALLLLIALVSWPQPARLVRGVVLGATGRGFVEAARGFGVPGWKIVVRHVLPETVPVLAAQALLALPKFILAEVTLSFLGLGAGGPEPSWGGLLVAFKHPYLLQQEWWQATPALLMLPYFLVFAVSARSIEKRFVATTLR